MSNSKILLAEDSSRIASFIVKGLTANGFSVVHVSDGAKVIPELSDKSFQLLILDLGLPNREGLSILEELRGTGNDIPVIVLTARDSTETTVASFKGGADDFMSKPFSFEELLARVQARIRLQRIDTEVTSPNPSLTRGNITLELLSRQVTVAGETHELTPREFVMLEMFLQNPGQVISREQLLDRVWGYDHDPGSNVVDVYVRYLRKKIGSDAIVSVRGLGYKVP
jgi:DNA-binding response OmpR family regulator